MSKTTTIKGFKGFDKDLKCRDFQYKVGKTVTHNGNVEACNSGLHFCENPLDVLGYYPPADSRYAEVEGSGTPSRDGSDSKVAVKKLSVKVEIGLRGLLDAGVKFILEKVDWSTKKESNTGYQSAATNTGNQSAATNTGYRSAATNTGDQSAATNTGNQSAATVEGASSVALAAGIQSKASAIKGSFIVIADWRQDDKYDWQLIDIYKAKAGTDKIGKTLIKPDTFYWFENGILKSEKA